MATGATPRAADFTGRERANLTRAAADATKVKAKEDAEAELAEATRKVTEVVDVKAPRTPVVVDDVEAKGVAEKEMAFEVIQVIEDISQMTFGVGNNYDFERGVKYKVPADLAQHLRERGYVH